MWQTSWRDNIWNTLDQPWDLIIVGGGITGAGILREAACLGLKALLVEQRDFAWGTSSRSSKMVHGGLRYLKQGDIFLTRASVLEREHLLREGPGLIDPLGFLLSIYDGDFPGRWTFEAGLTVYDLLALRWGHHYYSPEDFRMLAPHVAHKRLKGGFRYGDAQTDDARLVLRVIREAVADGGTAINYACAESLLRDDSGAVIGVRLRDAAADRTAEVHARVVINATGAWADRLRGQMDEAPRIRPLRGSHLLFTAWRFPLAQAVTFLHPVDRRPVFVFPWEGVTLVGTTDVDHGDAPESEPHISPDEVAYLMAAVEAEFPSLGLTLDDVVATFSGVRPVIGTGQADPSKESREHVIWEENGLMTVTGGKLTTFRLIARDVLKAACDHIPGAPETKGDRPVLNPVNVTLPKILDEPIRRRLLGRYGADAPALVAAAQPGELEIIPTTQTLWAELRWAARDEGIIHLDDLLLRRVRLGLLLPEGGAALLGKIRAICQPELGWDDARWEAEEADYRKLWRGCYSLPDHNAVPDWKTMLRESADRRRKTADRRQKIYRRSALALMLAGLAGGLVVLFVKRRKKVESCR